MRVPQAVQMLVSIVLGGTGFAAGAAVVLAPLGALMDRLGGAGPVTYLEFMLALAAAAGAAFAIGTTWYLHRLDSRLASPPLEPGEVVRFRQYGFVIADRKYDPGRIMITDRRLFLLPTHFNPGPPIAPVVAPLGRVQARKDRTFGNKLARGFLMMKLKSKLVLPVEGRQIGYVSNIGYFLPPLSLFRR